MLNEITLGSKSFTSHRVEDLVDCALGCELVPSESDIAMILKCLIPAHPWTMDCPPITRSRDFSVTDQIRLERSLSMHGARRQRRELVQALFSHRNSSQNHFSCYDGWNLVQIPIPTPRGFPLFSSWGEIIPNLAHSLLRVGMHKYWNGDNKNLSK